MDHLAEWDMDRQVWVLMEEMSLQEEGAMVEGLVHLAGWKWDLLIEMD